MNQRKIDAVVRGACPHDCPDTCALLTTVRDGIAVKVAGAPDHGPTGGALCTKVAHYPERVYHPERLLHPMRRVGPKGPGARFERISWDQALDETAARLRAIAGEWGPEAILPYSYAGTMGLLQYGSMDRRFFHRLGASLLERTICATAGGAGITATLGGKLGMDMECVADARLIILWATNSVVSNLHFWTRVQEAKRRGAKLVAIDPYRTQTAERCHVHLAPLPGTDAALALGLMHVLIAEDLQDHDYIARHTLGYAALKERVADYPPERVAALTGLRREDIIALARDYGSIRPAAIRLNYGANRHAGGGMAVRTIACLPALVGAWRDPAGGLLLTSSGHYPVDEAALERPDLLRRRPRTINMSAIGRALLEADDPPVKAVFVYNSNPVAVAPESRKVVEGFMRPDLFVVVHELFRTDTADYADILLPATSQLEHLDIHKSYGHLHVLANLPAIAPRGEALPNTELFRRLAKRMGFTEACFDEDDETLARQAFRWDHPAMAGITWERLKAEGFARLNLPTPYAPFAQGGFATLSGKCEFYSAALAAQGHDPLPAFVPPREWRGAALAQRFPLAFISPPARNFLNSSFANLERFREQEKNPWLDIHPQDAAARAIAGGDSVRVFNDRGEFRAVARVTERARPGVVVSPSIWWRKLSPDGRNVNEVTSQALADLGGGATFLRRAGGGGAPLRPTEARPGRPRAARA